MTGKHAAGGQTPNFWGTHTALSGRVAHERLHGGKEAVYRASSAAALCPLCE